MFTACTSCGKADFDADFTLCSLLSRHHHYLSFFFRISFEFCNFGLFLAGSLAGDWLTLTVAVSDR
jgi:hypothetical protein